MLCLRGAPALSDFRLAKLTARLREAGLVDLQLFAEFMHFVDLERSLEDQQQAVLGRLLRYGPSVSPDRGEPEGRLVLVVPRPGTISPWSSKATDIAHNSGLTMVRRLERGTAFYLTGDGIDEPALQTAADLLHDRMTEVALFDLADADQLFRQAEPRPCTSVDLLGGGREALVAANGRAGPGPVRRRDRLSGAELRRPWPQPHRHRTDDVRAGQLRALSAQDLQRRLDHRW